MNTPEDLETIENVPPADASIFKFPAGMQAVLLVGAFLCVGLIVFAISMQLAEPERGSLLLLLLVFAVCGPGAALCINSFRRFRDSIAVNNEGIWYLRKSGHSIFMAWADVADVKAEDTMQRLILKDASGTKLIRAEYQLENFAALRKFILVHTKDLDRLHPSPATVFHRTRINKIILAVLGFPLLLIAMQCYRQGVTGGFWVTLLFGIYALILIAFDPSSAHIGDKSLVIRYPLWKHRVSFDTITKIAIEDVSSRGNVWAAVVIETRQNRRISLYRFREGSIALNDALQSAWRASKSDRVTN